MTRVRRVAALLAALLLSLSLGIAPTIAASASASAKSSGAPAWACGPDGGGISARGGFADSRGVVREKDTGQVVKELPRGAQGAAPADFAVTVPVWFHVVTDGSLGNVSNAKVQEQLQVLGSAYAANGTGFSFSLAGITRTDNRTWYRLQSGGAEHAMKTALKRGGDETLNVYVNAAGGYLGYAYLPEITNTAQAYLDGVVLDWETLPGVSSTWAGVADEGDTLVHEVGHWLNLEHTFFGQCNKNGDFVADTPAQKTATSGCPVGKDTCPAAGLDPIQNYMDYSDDDCMDEFTPGQVQRMRDAWLFWRAS